MKKYESIRDNSGTEIARSLLDYFTDKRSEDKWFYLFQEQNSDKLLTTIKESFEVPYTKIKYLTRFGKSKELFAVVSRKDELPINVGIVVGCTIISEAFVLDRGIEGVAMVCNKTHIASVMERDKRAIYLYHMWIHYRKKLERNEL